MADKKDRERIFELSREIANLIAESEEIERFKQAEKKISAHMRVQELITDLKKKQKKVVALEYNRNYEAIPPLEKEMEAIQEELDSIPVVQEFKQTQIEIDELLQLVSSIIGNTLSKNVIVSTGGDPLYNDTGYEKAIPPNSCANHKH
jgi:cell fate (sporulation/competence/biofilm development) regulator YmcA (YheA/YmcA/DUF963 family)